MVMNWSVIMCVILSVLCGCRPNSPTIPNSESDTQPVRTQPIRVGDSMSEFMAKLKASSVPFKESPNETIGIIAEYFGTDIEYKESKWWFHGLIFPDGTRILIKFRKQKGHSEGKIYWIEIGAKGEHWKSPAWSKLSREVEEFNLEDFAMPPSKPTTNSSTHEGAK